MLTNAVVLVEGEKEQFVNLEVGQLLQSQNICDVSISVGGKFRVSNFRKIGYLRTQNHHIEIRPKVRIASLLQLIDSDLKAFEALDQDLKLSASDEWANVLSIFFAMQLEKAFLRGPLMGYVSQNSWERTIRGAIQFSTLAGSHRVSSPELPLSFDEFSPNIAENRIILTAIEVLKRNFNLSDSIREVLLRNQAKLSGVDLIPIGGRLPPYVISELNQHYKALLLTAELIVIGESVSASNGEKIAKSFLIDMAQLFENYLEVSFSKLSNQINLEFKPQKGNQYLDDQKIFRIRPDYLWFKNSTAVHLADAKYKVITNKSEISNADVNQIIAYCNRFGLKAGHLIYASSPEFMTKITNSDLELYVHQIDLSQSKKILEENVRDVFHAIIQAGV